MPTTSRSAGGPRSEKSRNSHQARDRRTRRQELRKRHLRQDWRKQPSRTRSVVRGPNTRRAGYSCDFEIPLGNCARNQRTRETVCNRPRRSLSKECLLSASPTWTITAFEWESPGRRYPRLARSKGVATCLRWREIPLALPDWNCFSAPSTNRTRTSGSKFSVSSTRRGATVQSASPGCWLIVSIPASSRTTGCGMVDLASDGKGVTERRASTSRRTCSIASSFSLSTS